MAAWNRIQTMCRPSADLRVAIAELETRLIDCMTGRDWRLLLAMTAIVGIAVAILKL